MILKHKDRRMDIQDRNQLETCWNQIQQDALRNNEVPYFLRINGLEIYENLYETLQENITTEPLEAELVTIHQDQLLMEIRHSLEEYISRVLSQLEQLADPFYGEVESNHWNKLGVLLEGLDWVMQSWSGLASMFSEHRQQQMLSLQRNFEQATKLLLQEMEAQNHTGIGDCLLYELQPLLEEMQHVLRGAGD